MSTIVANAVSVPSPAPGKAAAAVASTPAAGATGGQLARRAASAAVMAPVALVAAYAGMPWFELMVAALAMAMALEWAGLALGAARWVAVAAIAAASALAIAFAAHGRMDAAVAAVALAAALGAAAAALVRDDNARWAALGACYVALPCASIVWLREIAPGGRETVVWLLLVVWATDIGAYAVGRTVGGPRLAPKVSPGKTWSGLLGGMTGAGLAAAGAAAVLDIAPAPGLIALGAGLAVVAQAGDLIESAVKRRFHAKDAGWLIPGHGGVLDRVDGVMTAAPALAAVAWAAGGGISTW